MKNNTSDNLGFTLVEIIGVIVLITLIGLIVYPTILTLIVNNKEKAYNEQIKNIEEISYRWSVQNEEILNQSERYLLSFNTLISSGFIKNNEIINPKTGNQLEGCVIVSWQESYNQYKFEYTENCI